MGIVGEGAGVERGGLGRCGGPVARCIGPAHGWRAQSGLFWWGAAEFECGGDWEAHLGRGFGGEEACQRSWGARRRRDPRRSERSGDVADHDEVADVAVRAKQRILPHEATIGVLPGLVAGRRWHRERGSVEQFASQGKAVDLNAVCEEAEMAYADEASGDDVPQKAPDEFHSAQGHGPSAAAVFSILVPESDGVHVVGEDAFVADGDPVSVATEVAQDLFRAGHGGLGVDDEFLNGRATQQKAACALGHTQAARDESDFKRLQELPSKDRRELSDWQEEPRSRRDPLSSVEAQSSAGRDAVDVGVIPELLIPGVENGDEAGGGPEVVATHVDHGLRGGLEQEGVGGARVATEERIEAVRESEDLVKVENGEQVVDLGLDPERLIQTLTLGTVPVAAGVVDGILTSAVITSLFMATQGRGATCGQRMDDSGFVVCESRNIPGVCPEDVSQFRPHFTRPLGLAVGHGSTPESPRPSIGRADSWSD
jgi:hypothetical protein